MLDTFFRKEDNGPARRKNELFSSSFSVVVSAALVTGSGAPVFAQPDTDFSRPPSGGWDSSKLSQAVLTNVNKGVRNYALKKQADQLTASDVEIAAASIKTAIDHLQEIGYNAALEKRILDNEEAFLNYHLSDNDVSSFQKTLAAQGLQVDVSRVRSSMDPDYEARQQFLSTVKKQGLYKTELAVVEEFRTQELQFVSQSLVDPGRSIAIHQPRNGRFVLAMSRTCRTCLFTAAVGLASGCGITGFACEAAVVACGMCAMG
jgi:hypothetical protein